MPKRGTKSPIQFINVLVGSTHSTVSGRFGMQQKSVQTKKNTPVSLEMHYEGLKNEKCTLDDMCIMTKCISSSSCDSIYLFIFSFYSVFVVELTLVEINPTI